MLISRYILNSVMKTLILQLSVFLFSLFLGLDRVEAHRINLFAWVEGDSIHVESKFSSGKNVKAGKIIVTDPQGNTLVKGITNAQGEYTFKVPKKTELKIIISTGTGHRAEWLIPASEIEGSAAERKQIQKKSPAVEEIIIGIGCILGLVVITLYFKNRKKKTKVSA